MRLTHLVVTLLILGIQADTTQFTPDQADWSTFYSKPIAVGNTDHSPNGVFWLKDSDWATWDGTIYRPNEMDHDSFKRAVCPRTDVIRGIREVFYEHNPFADVHNPTKGEVDEWHRIALNHLRALVGYTGPEHEAKKDHCMFIRALWGQERRFTTKWDDKYPGTFDSAYGPCVGGSNAHCGATFVPDEADQAPYLPPGHAPCGTTGGGSEGCTAAPKSDIPWSIKWSRAACTFIWSEGFWGGHVGPFFHREKFGFSFWDTDPSNNGNNAHFRGKWTGSLAPNLYPKEDAPVPVPSDVPAGCHHLFVKSVAGHGSFIQVAVDGITFTQQSDAGRGINVFDVDPGTLSVLNFGTFDTYGEMDSAGAALASFIDNIPAGHIVMLAVKDASSPRLLGPPPCRMP
eukprot:TRINITY_DN8553_c0_g1_i1.p1 TRINITY_DN8553_c0_g1~~TRINITY_DN8553_c0_g1_i1.p1  ORF type:complete len:418 (+),score=95.93 TRINITY_DN8553_c0_g1_i1:56-1255(+)